MPHRETISGFLRSLTFDTPVKIIDWGRGTKPVTNYIKTCKGCEYFGLDKLDHVGADRVIDIADQSVYVELDGRQVIADVAFCMEVLEHVLYPEVLINNIANHLKTGGRLILSAPFRYKIHSDQDYWRFTDQGLRVLLERNGFSISTIIPTEDEGGWVVDARI